jgi:4-hydroxy-tetrahydrodipicolinate synthase
MLPETVERLSAISNIVGIKEATGNLERARDIRFEKRVAVPGYIGGK